MRGEGMGVRGYIPVVCVVTWVGLFFQFWVLSSCCLPSTQRV